LDAVDPKFSRRLEPHLSRVLIVDPNPAAARMLAGLMRSLGARELLLETDGARALKLADRANPDLICVEHSGPTLDGEAFTRGVRRSDFACRRAPVIMVTADAFPHTIKGARDAGVHEFLRKPFTAADLIRRVEAVALKPRDWIEAMNYVGPDRRRFNSGEYSGKRKRTADGVYNPTDAEALAVAVDRSTRILRSAINQFESDPAQARRAIAEQASVLKTAAAVDTTASPRLAVTVAMLELANSRDDAPQATLTALVNDVLDLFEPNSAERAA
jgi:CheY-like chemotaxis protein